MKITITKDFGNFDVTATTEVTDEQAKELAVLGALYIFERAPSSSVEQKVFAPMLKWEKGERGTSYKRPSGFKRNSVAYSDELALEVEEAYNTTPGKLGEDEIGFKVVSVVENVQGEAGQAKISATELVDALLSTEDSTKQLRGTLQVLGMKDAQTADREAMIAFAHANGLGKRKRK